MIMVKILFLLLGFVALMSINTPSKTANAPSTAATNTANTASFTAISANTIKANSGKIKEIPAYLNKSIDWLAASQAQNGGWGSETSGRKTQQDPNAAVDPATTAFSAMALLRVGNTLDEGQYSQNVKNALTYLLEVVEKCSENAKNITDLQNTQPQRKLGGNIDVAMTSQFFGQIEPTIKDKALTERVHKAWDKCVRILENAQQKDGSWVSSGWAPVLNSAMANNALEIADKSGRTVNKDKLAASRRYQSSNASAETAETPDAYTGFYDGGSMPDMPTKTVSESPRSAVPTSRTAENAMVKRSAGSAKMSGFSTSRSAGVALYSVASTQRATAEQAKTVKSIASKQKTERATDVKMDNYADVFKVLKDEKMSDSAAKDYAVAYISNQSAAAEMNNEAVLSGFGNNGGEEYLSYMMMSESMVSSGGGKEYDQWYDKMKQRFEKVQNQDSSWSGHHCITSPVFCTAAVILCLTADRNVQNK